MRWMLACALGLALSACGGGGGGDDGGSAPTPTPGGGTSLGFNGPLSGQVIYREGSASVLLDLTNGARASLPLPLDFYPAPNSMEIAGIDTSTRATTNQDRVQLLDLQSGGSASFNVSRSAQGIARLSPDRQRVALNWANEAGGEPASAARLSIFTRAGALQTRIPAASAWAWMPNGRLLMAQGATLMTTDAAGANAQTIATLPATPVDVSPSRDGSRIALTLPSGGQTHVWLIDATGANLRQLTTSSTSERNPEWSPDGEWLLMRQDPNAACPTLVAVATDATATVTLNGSNSAVVQKVSYKAANNATTGACPASTAAWLR